jgi:hypothetical protein
MKQLIITIITLTLFSSCYKQLDTTATTTTTTTDTTTKTTSTTVPKVRFFNVMDYGNVYAHINGSNIGGVALYYPTTYQSGVIGTNNIWVTFGSDTILNQNVELLAGKYYSCFVYRIGYNWMISLVSDDLTAPATGNANVRILDFRTQAWFSYIGINFFSPGNSPLVFNNRNFLDHESYSSYSNFNTITAGTYTITLFTSTANLLTKSYTFASTKTYTVVLMTQAGLTAAQALQAINVDIEQNY